MTSCGNKFDLIATPAFDNHQNDEEVTKIIQTQDLSIISSENSINGTASIIRANSTSNSVVDNLKNSTNSPVVRGEVILPNGNHKTPFYIVRPQPTRNIQPKYLLPSKNQCNAAIITTGTKRHYQEFSNQPDSSNKNNVVQQSYMVSGAPEHNNLRVTMMPDDLTKHSTKERLRR